MNNSELGQKIKALRTSKGLSQEELAQQAGISLRTVQRIENDEAEPRGDTLIRLAAVLNIKPEELAEVEKPEPGNKNHIALLNLSALAFIAFPLLGVLVPLMLWSFNKGKMKNIDEAGKKLLNFQISWCIAVLVVTIGTITAGIISSGNIGVELLSTVVFGLYGMYILNFVFVISNTIRALNSRGMFYKPAVQFIR
ncbi:DUF4870 domain-containing protein [Mucilaginibacter sp. RCC_168]|uniref:DUF4870 domain-containing protein n=1 Tax=Mucilaginibacter sp. RCC_168 TaxID=3239221 RepID=UPI00352518AE